MDIPTDGPSPGGCWGGRKEVQQVSLQEIMSEELAKSIAQDDIVGSAIDNGECQSQTVLLDALKDASGAADSGVLNDEVIAHMLQSEFDREHNEQLTREARKFNGNSKVTISFNNYLLSHVGGETDDSEEEDDSSPRHWDSFESREKETPLKLGRCGYARDAVSGQIRTKHDREVSERQNAKRIMELPPGLQTGDGGGFAMNLSNRVYNALKSHAHSDTYRRQRVRDKTETSTAIQAIDKSTRLMIYKLVNRGILEEVHGVIATGKESVIIYATGAEEPEIPVAKDVVIKAYKTSLDEYKTRGKYLKDDYRYRDCLTHLNPRTLIASWARKELQNLYRLMSAGVPCPEPFYLKKHVLLMSLIGTKGVPAPKLKDVKLSTAEWELAYSQVVELMKAMYHGAELVHCDLSEYNILYFQGQCYFIDVSQALLKSATSAHTYLYRDCQNICKFFTKHGVHEVLSPAELFRAVSGLPFDPESLDFDQQICDFEKDEECLAFQMSRTEYPFDFFWKRTQGENQESSDEEDSKMAAPLGETESPSHSLGGEAEAGCATQE